jgi:hypothetical protein
MSERARALSATADEQIADLIDRLARLDQAALRRPCPGREKLGDGTIGAAAWHTADKYRRIADFVQTSDRLTAGAHRLPRPLRTLGHGPQDHAGHDPSAAPHDHPYTADDVDLGAVLTQLGASRQALTRIGELTDRQLDAVPPKDSFRFCDGQRTLEQVLAGLLRHQAHQLQALRSAA